MGRYEPRLDGRPLVQAVRERTERGDEKEDDSGETGQAANAVASTASGAHVPSFCRLGSGTKKSGRRFLDSLRRRMMATCCRTTRPR
jgi:hypothetical protein